MTRHGQRLPGTPDGGRQHPGGARQGAVVVERAGGHSGDEQSLTSASSPVARAAARLAVDIKAPESVGA